MQRARHANQSVGITGALLYGDRQFLQTIEGPKQAVEALYQRLLRDERHAAVIKIADHALAERVYPAQDMTFRELPAQEMHLLIGSLAAECLRAPTVELTPILRRRLENARAYVSAPTQVALIPGIQ